MFFLFIIAPPWKLLRHFYFLICPLPQNTTEILFVYLFTILISGFYAHKEQDTFAQQG